jgi:hypothetical protein
MSSRRLSSETPGAARIFGFYYNLLTLEEKAAYKSILGERKIESAESPAMKKMLRRGWVSSEPEVQVLLADGEEAFMERVRDRVLRDHRGEVFLNHCPRCGASARTPRAQQCPTCFFSWRGEGYFRARPAHFARP